MSAIFCQNCGARLTGLFCAQCGTTTTPDLPEKTLEYRSPITFPEPSTPEVSNGSKIIWGISFFELLAIAWLFFSETDADRYYREQGYNPSAVSSDPSKPKAFKILVGGTPGIPFQGSYMTTQSNGQSTSKSVEGVTPTSFNASGWMISTAFQKKDQSGELSVSIQVEDIMLKTENTTAPYGMVSIATQ